MRMRLRIIIWSDTTLLELAFLALTLLEGIGVLASAASYTQSALFAPIAGVVPFWVVGGLPWGIAALWAWGLWGKLSLRPHGGLPRLLAVFASFGFWLLIAVLVWGVSPAPTARYFYAGHVGFQVFMFIRLRAEWARWHEDRPDGPA